MGFNLGAFGRGLASGIESGSRLATEGQQRELRQQQIDLNNVTAEDRRKLQEYISSISGPRQEQRSALPAEDGKPSPSFYDTNLERLYSLGLSPDSMQLGMQALNQYSQMQARGVGTQIVDALVGGAPKEQVQALANKLTEYTPGVAKTVNLQQNEQGQYLGPDGKPLSEAQAVAYVRSYLNDNLESRYQAARDEEKGQREERGLNLEARRVDQGDERLKVLKEQVRLQGISTVSGAYKDLAMSDYYLREAAAVAGAVGIDPGEMNRRLDDFSKYMMDDGGIVRDKFEQGSQGYNQAVMLTENLLLANPSLRSPTTAARVASDFVESAMGEGTTDVLVENGMAILQHGEGVYQVPLTLLSSIMPGEIVGGQQQAASPPQTERGGPAALPGVYPNPPGMEDLPRGPNAGTIRRALP